MIDAVCRCRVVSFSSGKEWESERERESEREWGEDEQNIYETKNRRDGETTIQRKRNKRLLLLLSYYYIMIYRRAVRGWKSVIGQTSNFPTMRGHMVHVATGLANEERPHRAAVSGFLTCFAGRMIVTSHAGGGFSRKRARSDVANVLLLRSPPPKSPPPSSPPPPPSLLTVKHIFYYTDGNWELINRNILLSAYNERTKYK